MVGAEEKETALIGVVGYGKIQKGQEAARAAGGKRLSKKCWTPHGVVGYILTG